MAKWDKILSLPVQNPPALEFSSKDLVWSNVEGCGDKIDRISRIPFGRVDDFVRGESANEDCPTRFHVEARRINRSELNRKHKVDATLEYILYWCSFGPDDHRKGGFVRPSRTTYVPKKNSAGRPNTKRGCRCHFIVKCLFAEPSVALIIYNHNEHIDTKGLYCHGPQDENAAGTRAMYAPYISEDLRLRVLSLLYVGVSVETIMERHKESVERQGGPCNGDAFLNQRYVRKQERSIRVGRFSLELDSDDARSVNKWVESHQSWVFFYEDFSDSEPFTLGIQTEWQLQQMIRFGNRRLLASDSRFGTKKLKYPVHSLVVFNSDNKAIPVAWIITPKFASGDAYRWMRALYNRVCTKDPSWKIAGFVVDDPSTDILSIKEVFQCSILICFWRVRHAWHKNLRSRCSDVDYCAEISKKLGESVSEICKGHGNADILQAGLEDFIDAADFVDYFKAVWYPRLGLWVNALKSHPVASHETSSAMESYHNLLRLRLVNEKDNSVYERVDWLVHKLGTKVHSYFWLDEYSGKGDFARYRKDEWCSGVTVWRKSVKIPDADITMEDSIARVVDQEGRSSIHIVQNPGSEFALCDCDWANAGNLCEHVIKTIKVYRDRKHVAHLLACCSINRL
ncbi:OLC1v1016700C1 [Oldenlandia corymbosa var. corymbosa]|uniref:OLC1v1016700C1 n=1 Tax=Oldenlandia corymbosa var. corymbosa TaxID=529605 RepID=A0AAV1E7Q2_OLDCO|nr:OLC1v1016700C1 [Oldenlandia corymbosa var. corymbosa]